MLQRIFHAVCEMFKVHSEIWCARSQDSSLWRVPRGDCQMLTKLSLHYPKNAGVAESQQRSQHKTKREKIRPYKICANCTDMWRVLRKMKETKFCFLRAGLYKTADFPMLS